MAAITKEPIKRRLIDRDPMAVTWSEDYSDLIGKMWNAIPHSIHKILATFAIFAVGISLNGTWVNIIVHLIRQFSDDRSTVTLESLRLENLGSFFIGSCVVSYLMYFSVGGFLHIYSVFLLLISQLIIMWTSLEALNMRLHRWYFYVRQRDRAEEWKCQPNNFLSPELERHEIMLGSSTLFLNATVSAILACYISNGGYSTVYYDIEDYGWLWFLLQFAVIFIYQDYATYWMHRIYHIPLLYKHFHKLHHKYKQPTAFSVTAIHPVESLSIQCVLVLPIFVMPTHWFPFYAIALYTYYHGIIDHSGINFKAYWWQPWQPDAIFHDNHHQYFHVNFGFNIGIWDKLHGTYRRKDRVYTEEIFYGKGKGIDEVSAAELKADLEERDSENPLAYRDNKMEFKFSDRELKAIRRADKPGK